MTPTPITAADITKALMGDWLKNFVLPRYQPARWWECDVFEVTPANYWREYEVKVSRSDFKIDGKKTHHRKGSKHDLLRLGSPNGPTCFWFATPSGLIAREELPDWAGLIEFYRLKSGYLQSSVAVKAPRLHDEPLDGDRLRHAKSTCYYRMHRAFGTPQLITCEEGAGI